MTREVEFHSDAVEETRAAIQWYAERSVHAAESFLTDLEVTLQHLADNPERLSSYLQGTRRAALRTFPYLVVFRESQDRIQIVAVAHAKRKPGYWRKRQ